MPSAKPGSHTHGNPHSTPYAGTARTDSIARRQHCPRHGGIYLERFACLATDLLSLVNESKRIMCYVPFLGLRI